MVLGTYTLTLYVNRARLDGCILGVYTKVGAKADLSRCITQPGYEVSPGGEQLAVAL